MRVFYINQLPHIYCPNCWQTFEVGDWQMVRGASTCFGCRVVLISAAQRQAGFKKAMERVDTATLQRWAKSAISCNRRFTAAQVLQERGL